MGSFARKNIHATWASILTWFTCGALYLKILRPNIKKAWSVQYFKALYGSTSEIWDIFAIVPSLLKIVSLFPLIVIKTGK